MRHLDQSDDRSDISGNAFYNGKLQDVSDNELEMRRPTEERDLLDHFFTQSPIHGASLHARNGFLNEE